MLSVFTDLSHSVAVTFVCGRSKSVGLSFFSDFRKPLNLRLSCSWRMSLVFLALAGNPALPVTSRHWKWLPDS